MQKKIIASLLVSPVAISAMADITVSGLPIDGWEPVSGAVTGGIVNGNKVTCPIGTGSITNVFAAPAPGKYKIVFNDLTNAGVTISSEYVDDSSIVVSDSGAVEFTVKDFDPETVKDGVAVTFTVTPVSAAAEFSFEQSPIAIVFDFADVDLSTATDDIPEFKDLIEQEEPSEKYNELVSQKAELESEKANLLKKVQDYPGEATAEDQDDAEQVATANENNLKTYVDYGLYEDPYGITDEINDLITKINALNTAIEAENDKYTALDRNTATKAQAQTAINGLNDKLTALTTLYNNVKTAFENANQKVDEGSLFDTKGTVPYTAAQTALTELQTSFDETFADLNDPTLEWDEDAVTAVGTKISEAETALNTLQTDLNNYNGFLSWFANTSGFEKEYNSARININGLQAIDGYIGLFDEWKAEQIALVNAQVTIVEDAKKPIVVGSTAAEIQAAETTIANAVTAIQGIKNAAVVLINGDGTDANIGQNALMTNALAKVQELTDALNEKTSGMTAEILKKLLPGTDAEKQAIIDGLNDAVKDVQNAIADVKTECEGKYATRTLSATDYADDAEKVVAVATAETALDNYITTNKLNEVQAAANKIAEVNAAIKKFEDDLDSFKEDTKPSEDKEGVNFPNLFAGNVKGFEAAKEALNVSNYSTDADKILAQITTTTGQASTIHNVVKTAANTAAAFTSALETLRDPYISDKSKWLLTGDDATFSIDDFEDKVTAEEDVAQGWSESYDSIVTLANKPNVKGEEVLTAANTLQKAMNAHPWADAMKTLFNELEDNGTKSNYAVVDAALTAVENNTNAPVAAEAATLRSALDQIKTSIDALDADDPDWILPADNSGDSSDSSDDSSTENLSETEGEGGDSGVTESDDTVNPAIALKAAAAIAIDEDLSDLMKKVKKYADAQTAYGTLKDNLKTVMDQITEDSDYCENSVSGDATMQYFSKIIGEAANVASQTFAYPTAENTLYAQYNGLVKKLDDYLKEGAIGGESAGNKTNEQSFAQNCTDVTTYAKAFYDDMVDNEQSLYALLDLSDSVRKILEGDLAQLSGNSKEEGVTNYDPEMPAVNKAYNKIKDLLDKDLKAADDGVANDYKVGKCSKNQSTLEEPYTTIKSKAKSIIDDLDTQYKPLVEAANAEIVDNSGVKAAIAKANSAYSAAIKVFNAYKSLTNPGYKAYVASQPNYRGHEELYSFATKIINITNGYESYVTQKNDALEVIDENEFVAKFVDPLINGVTVTEGGDTTGGDGEGDGDETTTPTTTNVPSYIAQIEALQVQIINDYNGWGASYFEKLSTQVSTNIADATTELGLLGLSESAADILEDASDALDSATKKYEEAEKLTPPAKSDEVGDGEEEGGTPSVGGSDDDDDADTVADVDTDPDASDDGSDTPAETTYDYSKYTEMVGYVVGFPVAGELDPYADENGLNLSAALTDAWNTAYTDATNKITKWNQDVSGYGDYVTDAEIAEYNTVAAAALKAINDANDLFNANEPATYKTCIDALNGALATLTNKEGTGAYDTITATYDKNSTQQSTIDTFNADVKKLNGDLTALQTYVSPMGAAATISYSDIEDAISAVSQKISDYTKAGTLVANADEINKDIEDIDGLIQAKYQAANEAEVEFLKNVVDQAKNAYNNAFDYVNEPDYDGPKVDAKFFEVKNGEINGLEEEVNALQAPAKEDDAFKATAIGYEESLSSVIAELQRYYKPGDVGEESVATLLQNIKDHATEVGKKISDAYDDIEDYYPALEDYMLKYQQLQKDVLDIVTASENAGDNLITQAANYNKQLDDIEAALEAMKPEVAKAKEAAQAQIDSDAQATVLMGQYNSLLGELETVETTLGKYEVLEKEYLAGSNVSYGQQLTILRTQLGEMKTWIEAENAEHKLTSTSKYETEDGVSASSIDYLIKSVMLNGSKTYATTLNNVNASDAVLEVKNKLLTTSLLEADKVEISAEATTLENRQKTNKTAIADFAVSKYQTSTTTGEGDDAVTTVVDEITDENYQDALSTINSCITTANDIISTANGLLDRLQESKYVPGAVIGGTEVTPADISQIAVWASEGMTVEQLTALDGATVAAAADLDGNEVIDVNDVTLAIQIYLNGQNSQVLSVAQMKLARYAAPAVDHSLRMGIAEEGENDGVRRFAITLDNTMPIIAGQIDLTLPAGMRVVDASVAERNSNHSVIFSDNGDYTRVLIFSMDNAAFDSTTGAVVYIDVEGVGNLNVEQMMVTDSYLQSHILEGASTSLVDTIIDGAKEAGSRIYNAAGMMFNKLQKGINIIRDANGKVRKEYNRK